MSEPLDIEVETTTGTTTVYDIVVSNFEYSCEPIIYDMESTRFEEDGDISFKEHPYPYLRSTLITVMHYHLSKE